MRKFSNHRAAAALVAFAPLVAGAAAEAGEQHSKAVGGPTGQRVSVFTLAQDYRSGAPPMPVLFTLHVSNRRALEFFCTNRPRFHEAMLSAVLTTQRGRRGLDTAAIGGRARAIVARFMKRDWLVGVDAKVVDSANEAGPEVLKTRDRCAELRS